MVKKLTVRALALRQSDRCLMLLWFKDLISECNREVIIHRPNVSTLLSSAFIRDDLIAATRGPSICPLISCPFFWRGVNRPQVVSCHHQEGGDDMPGFRKKRWWWRRLGVILSFSLSHPFVWLVRHAWISFFCKRRPLFDALKRVPTIVCSVRYTCDHSHRME